MRTEGNASSGYVVTHCAAPAFFMFSGFKNVLGDNGIPTVKNLLRKK